VNVIFEEILSRIKNATGVKTQKELAEILGIREASISEAKKRGGIPHEWVVKLALQKNISPEWLLRGRGPTYTISSPKQGDIFAQMSFLIQYISRIAELIEIRGPFEKINKPISYIIIWKDEDPQFFHTDLNLDKSQDQAVVDFIRNSCWAAGVLVKYIDVDQKYFPYSWDEKDQIDLIDGLQGAEEDGGIPVIRELEQYTISTGSAVRLVEPLTPNFEFSISQMLTMARKILESKTIYTSALVSSIQALHKAVVDNELNHER